MLFGLPYTADDFTILCLLVKTGLGLLLCPLWFEIVCGSLKYSIIAGHHDTAVQ